MSTFPNSPRLQKGALLGLDPFNPLASIIPFQYNPETLSRTLRARTTPASGGSGTAPGEARRLAGPPDESFKRKIVLDATEQLDPASSLVNTKGIASKFSPLFSESWSLGFQSSQPTNQKQPPPRG